MAGNIIEFIFLVGLATTIVLVLAPIVWVVMIVLGKFDNSLKSK
jgi:hypothetical protein